MARTPVWLIGVCIALASRANAQFVRGDLYVAAWPDKIYRVEPGTWNVTLFADSGDRLNGVSAVTFSPSAQLLCSDFQYSEVLAFDAAGNGATLYDASSGVSGPYGENGLAYDAAGNLFVADFSQQQIRLFPAGGGAPSVFADSRDGIVFPDGLAAGANGDLFVANRGAKQVVRIDSAGNVAVFDTLPDDPFSIVVRANGDIYVACGLKTTVYRYPGGVAAQRTLLASLPRNSGNPALQFDPDEHTLYLSSYSTGNLVTIDPDTGATNEVIPAGGLKNAISIGAYGRGIVHATWTNFGAGFPGTNGIPGFTAEADPVLGTTLTLDLDNSAGAATTGVLFIGFQRTDIPSTWGSDLLVVPRQVLTIPLAAGVNTFTGDIPDDPTLSGLALELQAIESDPGAAKGISFTAGLELLLGV
jgi:streptogramin lyase